MRNIYAHTPAFFEIKLSFFNPSPYNPTEFPAFVGLQADLFLIANF
jgi:hypothetical protein